MTRRHASTGSATSARLGFGAVALALLCGFFYIGCDGVTPPNGGGGSSEEATIRGTVTNDATGEALVGAKVSIGDMAEATTDDAGEYSQTVPIGVYDLSFENDFFTTVQQTIAVGNGETATVDVALSPSQPVAIRTEVEGDPAPDGTVTLRAVTEVLDGATTVQGFNWSQGNSVEVIISGATTDTASVALPDVAAYKAELMKVLREPPVSGDQLPPNVPVPDAEEFPGGLPDRFQVVGINPFALEETGLVKVMLEVETSAGTYSEEVEIHAALPWKPASGIRNVPVGVPVLLSGKAQDAYDWALSAPAGSSASLVDATTQEPYYTPDVAGLYRVTVTDTTGDADEEVTLEIYAGTWGRFDQRAGCGWQSAFGQLHGVPQRRYCRGSVHAVGAVRTCHRVCQRPGHQRPLQRALLRVSLDRLRHRGGERRVRRRVRLRRVPGCRFPVQPGRQLVAGD
jgi:hypothetical protein